MVAAAVADVEGLEASRLEIDAGGPSYTADTLAALRGRGPRARAVRDPGQRRRRRAPHLGAGRRGPRRWPRSWWSTGPGRRRCRPCPGWRWERVEVPRLEVSSTELRDPGRGRPAARLPGHPRGGRLHRGARAVRSAAAARQERALIQPSSDETRQWAITAARAADAKQATDVLVLEVAEVLALVRLVRDRQRRATTARSRRSATRSSTRSRSRAARSPKRVEGLDSRQWVLMDYGDVVVHVFQQDAREFYDLERLWADVPRLEWAEAVA